MAYTKLITRSHVLVTFDDGESRTVPSENKKQFEAVIAALARRVPDQELRELMDGRGYIRHWACGAFKIADNKISWTEHPEFEIPACLQSVLREFAENNWPAESFCRFLRLLLQNPSKRSVETFYQFIHAQGLTIDDDGFVIGYKSVRPDWTDWHTGTVDNHPGCHPVMDRSKVDDDPKNECSVGFHFGGRQYVSTFGGSDKRVIAVRVNPADLVCVPHDCDHGKVRVCTYKVLREIPRDGEFKAYYGDGLVGESAFVGLTLPEICFAEGRECCACGTIAGDEDEFCRICGARLPELADEEGDDEEEVDDPEFCPQCGSPRLVNPETDDFFPCCTGCGYKF